MTDDDYQILVDRLPKEIVDNLIVPIANRDSDKHLAVMAFLMVVYGKGYRLTKSE